MIIESRSDLKARANRLHPTQNDGELNTHKCGIFSAESKNTATQHPLAHFPLNSSHIWYIRAYKQSVDRKMVFQEYRLNAHNFNKTAVFRLRGKPKRYI